MTHDLPALLIAAVVGTLAVARATRLVTADAYPPAEALRVWWSNRTDVHDGWRAGWGPLVTCPFCFAPYAAAVNLAWAYWSGLGTVWWLINVWAAVSYAAAMVVVRDEPPEE